MRKLILALILASPSWGAIAFVQAVAASTTGNTAVSTAAKATTSGNLLVASVTGGKCASTTNVLTDTAGDTFYPVISDPITNGDCVRLFIAPNITANASNVVTSTFGASQSFLGISVLEFSGLSPTAPRDMGYAYFCTTAVSPGCTTGPFSTFNADEVIVFGYHINAGSVTFTPVAGYTQPAASVPSAGDGGMMYKIVSTLQTGVTANVITSNGAVFAMVGVSLRAPVTGGGSHGSVQ